MSLAAGSAAAVLLAVEPMHLELMGVWGGLVALMAGRLVTLLWRYQSKDGPLPPEDPTAVAEAVPQLEMHSSSSMASSNSTVNSRNEMGDTSSSSGYGVALSSLDAGKEEGDEVVRELVLQDLDPSAEFLGHAASHAAAVESGMTHPHAAPLEVKADMSAAGAQGAINNVVSSDGKSPESEAGTVQGAGPAGADELYVCSMGSADIPGDSHELLQNNIKVLLTPEQRSQLHISEQPGQQQQQALHRCERVR